MLFYKKLFIVTIALSLFISCSTEDSNPEEMMSPEEEMMATDDMSVQDEMSDNDDVGDSKNETNDFLASGTLQTTSDYPTTGNFKIINTEEKISLELDASFSVEGGLPDLVISLSNVIDSQENAFLISDTAQDSGMQSLEIPSEVNFLDYKYVLLYCREFNQKVGFGEIILNTMN